MLHSRINIVHLLMLFVIAVSLNSCNDKSSLLVRTWKIENLEYQHEVPRELKPTIDRSVQEMRDNFTLEYFADGTYITKMRDNEMKGTWKLNYNSTKLTSTGSTGESKTYEVKTLTENEFVFIAVEKEEMVTFVMKSANK